MFLAVSRLAFNIYSWNSVLLNKAIVIAGVLYFYGHFALAKEYQASSRDELIQLTKQLQPGDRQRIKPGTYRGGIQISGIAGTAEAPIVIEAMDESDPPLFSGGGSAIHISGCNYLT